MIIIGYIVIITLLFQVKITKKKDLKKIKYYVNINNVPSRKNIHNKIKEKTLKKFKKRLDL